MLDDYGAAERCFDEVILVIAEGVQFEMTFIIDLSAFIFWNCTKMAILSLKVQGNVSEHLICQSKTQRSSV